MTSKIKMALLIEDDLTDQRIYRRVIERSGQVENLIAFQYADEALEYLKRADREPVDVIFLDINMPRMSGFEFLEAATKELGQKFANAVIIMLTTSLDPEDREHAEQFVVVREFINKPLTVDHVKAVADILSENARI